jgi:hypothetical protein
MTRIQQNLVFLGVYQSLLGEGKCKDVSGHYLFLVAGIISKWFRNLVLPPSSGKISGQRGNIELGPFKQN